MRQFVFRLEKLLEIKKHAEREKSLELAEVTGRYMKIENRIEELKIMKKQILKTRFTNADNDVSSLLQDELQMSAIKNKITKLDRELETIAVEREQIRQKYIDALKEKKVLEKLKDRKAMEYKKEEESRESGILDDLVMTHFAGGQEV